MALIPEAPAPARQLARRRALIDGRLHLGVKLLDRARYFSARSRASDGIGELVALRHARNRTTSPPSARGGRNLANQGGVTRIPPRVQDAPRHAQTARRQPE